MRYCVQPATAKDVALLALAMGDEDAGDTEFDHDDGEQKPLDHLLNAFLSSTEVWAAHDPQADRAGVTRKTIEDLRNGREPKSAPKDERAIYAFIKELYRNGRASDRAYKAAHAVLGDAGMVELVGLLGYYAMVAMTLNVFRMPVAEGTPLPFREPATR